MAGVGHEFVRFDYDVARKAPLTNYGEISEETMWDSLTYFLKAVIPVAEEAGVTMAMHPLRPAGAQPCRYRQDCPQYRGL